MVSRHVLSLDKRKSNQVTLHCKTIPPLHPPYGTYNGAFTLDVKSVLNKNLGGILGGTTQC